MYDPVLKLTHELKNWVEKVYSVSDFRSNKDGSMSFDVFDSITKDVLKVTIDKKNK